LDTTTNSEESDYWKQKLESREISSKSIPTKLVDRLPKRAAAPLRTYRRGLFSHWQEFGFHYVFVVPCSFREKPKKVILSSLESSSKLGNKE
jgi:hypothetical protein